jgi:hypothetical protein
MEIERHIQKTDKVAAKTNGIHKGRLGIWVTLAGFLILSCCGGMSWFRYWVTGGSTPYATFEWVTNVQVIGNSEEAWVLVEKHTRVGPRGWGVAFRTQVVRIVLQAVVMTANGLERRIDLKSAEFARTADKLSRKAGWQILYQFDGSMAFPDADQRFEWNGRLYQFSLGPEKKTLTLVSLDGVHSWSVTLMDFDPTVRPITSKERESLSDPELGGQKAT